MVKTSRFRLRKFISHGLHPVDNRAAVNVHITLRLLLFNCLGVVEALLYGLFCSLKSDPRCVHCSLMYLHPDSVP